MVFWYHSIPLRIDTFSLWRTPSPWKKGALSPWTGNDINQMSLDSCSTCPCIGSSQRMHNHLSMLPGPYEEAPLFIRMDIHLSKCVLNHYTNFIYLLWRYFWIDTVVPLVEIGPLLERMCDTRHQLRVCLQIFPRPDHIVGVLLLFTEALVSSAVKHAVYLQGILLSTLWNRSGSLNPFGDLFDCQSRYSSHVSAYRPKQSMFYKIMFLWETFGYGKS